MKYDWQNAGEEWSEPWGSSAAQWFGTILPRINQCLPTGTILEIAPGFGRWTNYLRNHCERLWIVDFSESCIEACRRRFGSDPRLQYFVNDGFSLAMIPDESIDFVFSFDSLVHRERDVLDAYLTELGCKLKIGGKGFFHHSNLGECARRERIPGPIRNLLIKAEILDWEHHRSPTMTAKLFRDLCVQHNLLCFRQELINWRGRRLIDCLSLFIRNGSEVQGATEVIRNPNFMHEAALVRELSRISPVLKGRAVPHTRANQQSLRKTDSSN
jgi:hypothetical protein